MMFFWLQDLVQCSLEKIKGIYLMVQEGIDFFYVNVDEEVCGFVSSWQLFWGYVREIDGFGLKLIL